MPVWRRPSVSATLFHSEESVEAYGEGHPDAADARRRQREALAAAMAEDGEAEGSDGEGMEGVEETKADSAEADL